jgi:hypothetical protein
MSLGADQPGNVVTSPLDGTEYGDDGLAASPEGHTHVILRCDIGSAAARALIPIPGAIGSSPRSESRVAALGGD